MTRMYRLAGGFTVLIAAATIGLAACSDSATNSPHVASLGNSGGSGSSTRSGNPATAGNSTTTQPKGDPTQLLDQWAVCMRSHGDRNQADPTIGANKVIDITISPAIQGGYDGYSGEYGSGGPGLYCRAYLNAAQTALRGGQPPPKFDLAKALRFSECMRANGIRDFPDATASGLSFSIGAGGDLNPSNPTFQNASKLCAEETGVHLPGAGPPPPGTIEIDGGPAGAGGANG
jgi:hypothetical protein